MPANTTPRIEDGNPQRELGFLNSITNQYNMETTSLMKRLINTRISLLKHRRRRTFLLTCRTEDMRPDFIENISNNLKHIMFRANKTNHKYQKLMNFVKQKVLNLQIEDCNTHIKFLMKQIVKLEEELRTTISDDLFKTFNTIFQTKNDRINNNCFQKHAKKLRSLRMKKQNFQVHDNDNNEYKKKWLVNLTDLEIPEHIKNVVSLGPQFNVEKEKLQEQDVITVIKNVENSLNLLPQQPALDEVRKQVVEQIILDKHEKQKHQNYEQKLLMNHLDNAKTYMKEQNILFTSADKGNVTVAISRPEYDSKVITMLSDTNVYEKLDSNPLKNLNKQLTNLCRDWKKKNYISQGVHKWIYTSDGNLPKCYALPKIHKKDIPYRLIVSYIDSPLYNISKFINNIISKNIRPSRYSVKNSLEFKKKIENIRLQDDEVLLSLDVTALFTNISQDAVIASLERRWTQIQPNCDIPWDEFQKAVNLILSSTFFSFNGEFYRQKFGGPMGSPLSPILSEIVMNDLESDCFFQLDMRNPTYFRYVDDSFMVLPNSKVDTVINMFNSADAHLKFTHEREVDQKLCFLDVEVERKNGKLLTNWYQKPTFSGRVLNFNSYHPTHQKAAMVYNLVDKAIKLSEKSYQKNNIQKVKDILAANSYPKKFVNKYIGKRIKFLNNKSNTSSDPVTRDKKPMVIVPHINNSTVRISRTLKNFDFNVVNSIHNKLNDVIIKGKDKTIKEHQTYVIYQIDCADDNCNSVYIGQTYRRLQTRINEHKTNISKHPKYHTIVTEHMKNNNHDFKWDRVKILDKEINEKKRLLSEMLHIKKNKNCINEQTDTDNLNAVYFPLLM